MLCSFGLGRATVSVGGLFRIISGNSFTSVLMLVDLAGSERVEQSLSSGVRLVEAKHINTSLLCLRNVIRDQLNGVSYFVLVFGKVSYFVDSLFVTAEYQQI